MQQFLADQFETFVRKADTYLTSECRLIVIGGAAAALGYHIMRASTDIDVTGAVPEELQRAFRHAGQDTGLNIPVLTVGVFDAPYRYENRLEPLTHLELKYLTIWVPERHDLALMKTVRGYENDIQAIQEMHCVEPLDFDILLERFKSEMTHVAGRHRVIRLNFLAMIEALFGPEKAELAEVNTREWDLSV